MLAQVPNQDQRGPASACTLVAAGSLEIGAHRPQEASQVAGLVPARTRVFVTHMPRHRLIETLPTLAALRKAGLEPVPHLAARRIESSAELEAFLDAAVHDGGVRRVLVIGGDLPTAAGPYPDGAALIRSRLFARAGLCEVALPGYPEGHPRIGPAELERALREKLALLEGQGLDASIITQFSFESGRIVEYCTELARAAPRIQIHIGLAGPTNPARLLRFAQLCGVSASLRALGGLGLGALHLAHTDPSAQLAAIARHRDAQVNSNIAGIHLFTFGGAVKAAEWMHQRLNRFREQSAAL